MNEVASGLYYSGSSVKGGHVESLNEGLEPDEFPLEEGLVEATPEQLLSLLIPRLEVSAGRISGYQRTVSRSHVSKVRQALEKGRELPPIMVSIYDRRGWITDGQHRALGAVAARVPLLCVVQRRNMADQIALFSDQSKQRRPSSDILILRGDSPYEEYIQDAVTDPAQKHAWAKLVAARSGDPRKLSPTTMRRMLFAYVAQVNYFNPNSTIEERWNKDAADELGELIAVFGDRSTNPHAFASTTATALAIAAAYAVRRQGSLAEDIERWKRVMPKFPFSSYAYVKRHTEMADRLLAHWNKRLSEESRIYRV